MSVLKTSTGFPSLTSTFLLIFLSCVTHLMVQSWKIKPPHVWSFRAPSTDEALTHDSFCFLVLLPEGLIMCDCTEFNWKRLKYFCCNYCLTCEYLKQLCTFCFFHWSIIPDATIVIILELFTHKVHLYKCTLCIGDSFVYWRFDWILLNCCNLAHYSGLFGSKGDISVVLANYVKGYKTILFGKNKRIFLSDSAPAGLWT